jgi:hypothetical protein
MNVKRKPKNWEWDEGEASTQSSEARERMLVCGEETRRREMCDIQPDPSAAEQKEESSRWAYMS